MIRKTPDWYYDDTLDLDFGVASHIEIEAPMKRDEAGTLYMEVDNAGDKVNLSLGPDEIKEIHDYLGAWLDWADWNGYV